MMGSHRYRYKTRRPAQSKRRLQFTRWSSSSPMEMENADSHISHPQPTSTHLRQSDAHLIRLAEEAIDEAQKSIVELANYLNNVNQRTHDVTNLNLRALAEQFAWLGAAEDLSIAFTDCSAANLHKPLN